MKILFAPQTRTGRWAVGLIGISIGLIALTTIISFSLRSLLGDIIFSNSLISGLVGMSGLLAVAIGVIAFITGVVGIVKYQERSLVVIIASLMGLYALFLILGELLIPH